MKKLMITLATVALGAAVQASTVSWGAANIGPVKSGDDMSTYTAYIVDDASYAYNKVTDSTVLDAIKVAASSTDLVKTSSTATTGKLPSGLSFTDSYITGNTPSYYLIFVNGDESKFAVSQLKQGTVTQAGTLAMGFTNQASYTSADKWAAIAPEPTTGLLMLLGMGALALRRRRA